MASSLVFADNEQFVSGTVFTLKEIDQCQGPVIIKVLKQQGIISNEELKIERCTTKDNMFWHCVCKDKFDVKLLTPDNIKDTYDFTIQYYLKYQTVDNKTNSSKSLSNAEIENENFKRVFKMNDVSIKPGAPLKQLLNIEIRVKNVILFTVLMFILILTIIYLRFKRHFSGGDGNKNNNSSNLSDNDSLSYINKKIK